MSLAWLALLQAAAGGPLLVDGFERVEPWSAHPADGVELRLTSDRGRTGREADSALVPAAGIPEAWLEGSGVRVRGLSTWWGPLSYSVRRSEAAVTVMIEPGIRVPPGGILVRPPSSSTTASGAVIDGRPASLSSDGAVRLRAAPAIIRFPR